MRTRGPYPGGGSTNLSNYYNKPQVDALISTGGGNTDTALLTRVVITVTGDVTAGAGNAVVTPVGSVVSWSISGTTYSLTGAQTLTGEVSQAHATLGRFDLVIGKSDGTLDVTTGTAASTPSVPTAGAGEVAIGTIYIPSIASGDVPVGGGGGGTSITTIGADHGSASIAVADGDKLYFADVAPVRHSAAKSGNLIQITTQLEGTLPLATTIFDEDTGSEWTAAVGGSGSFAASKAASGQFVGTKCVSLGSTGGTAYLTLTKPSSGTIDPLTGFDVLSFYVKTDNGASPGVLKAVWQSGASDVSDTISINLTSSKYGFNPAISNWQRISVPRSNWVMTGGTATTLKLFMDAAGGVKIDKIELYAGVAGTFVAPPDVAGGSSGPWTLLNTITPSGTTVSITNPGGYRNLLITGVGVTTSNTTSDSYHYLKQYIQGTGLNSGSPSYRYCPTSMNNNEQFTGEARGYNAATAVSFNLRMLLSGINTGSKPKMSIEWISYGNNMPPCNGLWQWWADSFSSIDFIESAGGIFTGGTMKLFGSNDQETA